jgi:exodeoxyribonuclease III
MPRMKIATWNVNSVTARLPLLTRWLEDRKPDVVCLQELKCLDEKFPGDAVSELGYEYVTHGQRTYNGVAILSKYPITAVFRGFPNDVEGAQSRIIGGTVQGIRIVNVYMPNGQAVGTDKYAYKLDWMARFRELLDETHTPRQRVLLCGDFNVAPEDRDVHDPIRWEGSVLFSEPEKAALEHIRAWGFVDAFRQHTEAAGHYSWWDYRSFAWQKNHGLRIDHIWVSKPLSKECVDVWIEKETRAWERPSDHAPVVAEFK